MRILRVEDDAMIEAVSPPGLAASLTLSLEAVAPATTGTT